MATWLVQNVEVWAAGLYLGFLGVLTMISLIISPETNHKSLYTEQSPHAGKAEERQAT